VTYRSFLNARRYLEHQYLLFWQFMFLFNANDASSEKNMSSGSSNPLAPVLKPLAIPVSCFLVYRKELLYSSLYGQFQKVC